MMRKEGKRGQIHLLLFAPSALEKARHELVREPKGKRAGRQDHSRLVPLPVLPCLKVTFLFLSSKLPLPP